MDSDLAFEINDVDPDDNFFNEFSADIGGSFSQSKYYTIDSLNSTFSGDIGFTIINYNVRSFNANGLEFCTMLCSLAALPDVIILTETWLNQASAPLCNIDGYVSHHCYRDGGIGGGVSILHRDYINGIKMQDMCISGAILEMCAVKITIDTRTVFFLGIYRPPAASIRDFNEELSRHLHTPVLMRKTTVVAGDININLLQCDNNYVQDFVNNMRALNFLPTITKPTRFPSSDLLTDPSLLDHIWFNGLVEYRSGIICFDVTDHFPVFLSFNFSVKCDDKIKVSFRCHLPENVECFRRKLQLYRFNLANASVSMNTERFIREIMTMYYESFPIRNKFVTCKRLQKPWLTAKLIKCIRNKSVYYKLYRLGIISREVNNEYRNRVTRLLRDAKRSYYRTKFSRCVGDAKRTWRLIGEVLSKNPSRETVRRLVVGGVEVVDSLAIAEQFNNYFATVAESLSRDVPYCDISPLTYVGGDYPGSLFLSPVTDDECRAVILKLKNKSCDNNSLPVFLLKKFCQYFVSPLVKLINQSFTCGEFPDILKSASVTPVHKAGDKALITNYRPISVLPVIGKIFEKCIAARLSSYVTKLNLISPTQYGFLKGVSTVDAMVRLTELLYECLNEKNHAVALFVDLRRAFDTVNHEILLDKLQYYGLRGVVLSLFKSYLTDRRQCVKIGDNISGFLRVSCGVPQGSVLGPLLFLFYINDLPNVSDYFSSILFADDTTFLASGSDYRDLLSRTNVELDSFMNWTFSNRLSVNVEKTVAVLFTNRYTDVVPDLCVKLNDVMLPTARSSKFLGVIIDCKLKFDEHINTVCSKVAKSIGVLYALRDYAPENTMISLYYSLVYPYLTYCNIVWCGTYDCHVEKLFLLQKKILRIITGAGYLDCTDVLFARTKILKLRDLYKYLLCIHTYALTVSNDVTRPSHVYGTRNRDRVVPLYQRLTLCQHSVSYAGPSAWNDLPSELKTITSLAVFKVKLKQYFLSSY